MLTDPFTCRFCHAKFGYLSDLVNHAYDKHPEQARRVRGRRFSLGAERFQQEVVHDLESR